MSNSEPPSNQTTNGKANLPNNVYPNRLTQSYYAVLGVDSRRASEIDIRRAYRDLSKLYHPDTTQLPKEIAIEKFREINEAYGTISNAERRSEYDRHIQFSRFQYTRSNSNGVKSQNHSPKNLQTIDDDGLPSERPLSGGEMFALLLIGATLVGCLVLVILVAWLRGDSLLPEAIAPILVFPLYLS